MKKSIIAIIAGMIGFGSGIVMQGSKNEKKIIEKEDIIDRYKMYQSILVQWLEVKQKGKSLATWFLKKGYRKIAIYGMGDLGNRLYCELLDSDVCVKYGIDKNKGMYSKLQIIDADEITDDIDAIVVSVAYAYDAIEEDLSKRVNIPIVNIMEPVYNTDVTD